MEKQKRNVRCLWQLYVQNGKVRRLSIKIAKKMLNFDLETINS